MRQLRHPVVRLPALHLLRMSGGPHHESPAIQEAQCGPGAVPRNALLLRLQRFHLRRAESRVCADQPQAGGEGSAEEHRLGAVGSHNQGDQSAAGQCEASAGEAQSNDRTEGSA